MRADADALGGCLGHQTLHRDRIAGMETAGDACGANALEQSRIVANLVCAKTFTHVGIEIDCLGHTASFAQSAAALRTIAAGNAMTVRFLPAGDRALVVEFGDRVDRTVSAEVLRLDAVIRSA